VRIETVFDERTIEDWKRAHNEIVPVAALTTDEVRERMGLYHLEVVYLGDTLAGCTTVRPPEEGVATVIVRVLPGFRGQGLGSRLYDRAVAYAKTLELQRIETIVWAPNTAGLRFAEAKGFAVVERDEDWIVLRR
jgi:GNAT superfamily N-acetyltransferase